MSKEVQSKQDKGISRRTLVAGVGSACGMLALGTLRFAPTQAQLRPPGGQDENAMLSSCIRCQRCVEACVKSALVPAHLEDGIVGVRMPTTNFDAGWCDFCAESNGGNPRCVKACPTGALKLPAGASPENTIIGKASIFRDWCLAYRLIGCRFCYDSCPYDAIELDSAGRPHVVADRCNGCGACQASCVSLSSGSISAGATSRAIVVVPVSEFVPQD